jgi:release factor glutamine methyltransferase
VWFVSAQLQNGTNRKLIFDLTAYEWTFRLSRDARTGPRRSGLLLPRTEERCRCARSRSTISEWAGCVFAEDEADLLIASGANGSQLLTMLTQREDGLPLEQILGWAQFCGLRIAVEPGVFVPRRRTEFLVEQARALMDDTAIVVDLCCGSGAVGAALLTGSPGLRLYAVDIDPIELRCARRNVPASGQVLAGDLYEALPPALIGRVDVIVANAPYVPSDEIDLMPPEARDHEPTVALDGGMDGLDIARRVVAGAPTWLAPAGWLLIETSRRQAPALAAAFARAGLGGEVLESDEFDATVVIGSRVVA